MIGIVQEITKEFSKVTSESYHETNTRKKIKYPYLTYELSSEDLENAEGFYIDVDIFDKNKSYADIFTLEGELKSHFKNNNLMTPDMLMRFSFLRSNKAPTGDDLIKRRNLQFYCKVIGGIGNE